jgi:putative ABC transport system substrate-binding protein
MRRREFLGAIGGAAAWPVVARAQQPTGLRRIGVLMTLTRDNVEGQARFNSLVQGLEALGWIDGRNLHIDARWPGDDLDRLRADVADFHQSEA